MAIQCLIEYLETGTLFPGSPQKEMRMTVLNGKGNDNDLCIGCADPNQIKRGIIVRFAHNEVSGISAVGAHMEILFIHHLTLTLHTPATDAMTLDDTSGCKNRSFQGKVQAFFSFSALLPNSRTRNLILYYWGLCHGAQIAQMGMWRTEIAVRDAVHEGIVRQFGEQQRKWVEAGDR